jgi:hypothetical protein
MERPTWKKTVILSEAQNLRILVEVPGTLSSPSETVFLQTLSSLKTN